MSSVSLAFLAMILGVFILVVDTWRLAAGSLWLSGSIIGGAFLSFFLYWCFYGRRTDSKSLRNPVWALVISILFFRFFDWRTGFTIQWFDLTDTILIFFLTWVVGLVKLKEALKSETEE